MMKINGPTISAPTRELDRVVRSALDAGRLLLPKAEPAMAAQAHERNQDAERRD
jgi:hypothetical protein